MLIIAEWIFNVYIINLIAILWQCPPLYNYTIHADGSLLQRFEHYTGYRKDL